MKWLIGLFPSKCVMNLKLNVNEIKTKNGMNGQNRVHDQVIYWLNKE